MFYPPSEFVVKRDPAYGDQVAERQFTGITGLLKDDGLIFIKEFICDNKYLTAHLRAADQKHPNQRWQLMAVDPVPARPNCPTAFFRSGNVRVCMLLPKGTELSMYIGSELLAKDGVDDDYGFLHIESDLIAKHHETVVEVELPIQVGGYIVWDGRMAFELRQGSALAFVFAPPSLEKSFEKSLSRLKIDESSKSTADRLQSEHIVFKFDVKGTPADSEIPPD